MKGILGRGSISATMFLEVSLSWYLHGCMAGNQRLTVCGANTYTAARFQTTRQAMHAYRRCNQAYLHQVSPMHHEFNDDGLPRDRRMKEEQQQTGHVLKTKVPFGLSDTNLYLPYKNMYFIYLIHWDLGLS